jgi:hypothetical protein
MHRRVFAAVFAATFALPTATDAQLAPGRADAALSAGVRVTPFVGYLASFTRSEDWVHESQAGVAFVQTDVHIGGGWGGGVVVDAPLRNGFGVTAAAGYGSRGNTQVNVLQTDDAFLVDGHHVIFGRAGLAYQMPQDVSGFVLRTLGAAVHAGGTVMHERPRNRLGPEDALQNATHFGINIGILAELPFARDRLALQVGVEDNIMWWDNAALSSLPYVYFNRPGESADQTRASASASHAWLLRAGLSVRAF